MAGRRHIDGLRQLCRRAVPRGWRLPVIAGFANAHAGTPNRHHPDSNCYYCNGAGLRRRLRRRPPGGARRAAIGISPGAAQRREDLFYQRLAGVVVFRIIRGRVRHDEPVHT